EGAVLAALADDAGREAAVVRLLGPNRLEAHAVHRLSVRVTQIDEDALGGAGTGVEDHRLHRLGPIEFDHLPPHHRRRGVLRFDDEGEPLAFLRPLHVELPALGRGRSAAMVAAQADGEGEGERLAQHRLEGLHADAAARLGVVRTEDGQEAEPRQLPRPDGAQRNGDALRELDRPHHRGRVRRMEGQPPLARNEGEGKLALHDVLLADADAGQAPHRAFHVHAHATEFADVALDGRLAMLEDDGLGPRHRRHRHRAGGFARRDLPDEIRGKGLEPVAAVEKARQPRLAVGVVGAEVLGLPSRTAEAGHQKRGDRPQGRLHQLPSLITMVHVATATPRPLAMARLRGGWFGSAKPSETTASTTTTELASYSSRSTMYSPSRKRTGPSASDAGTNQRSTGLTFPSS